MSLQISFAAVDDLLEEMLYRARFRALGLLGYGEIHSKFGTRDV
jgi:hypothetical protein